MTDAELGKNVRSFISFGLAMKPSVTLHRHCENEPLPGRSVQFQFEPEKHLTRDEASTLDTLMKKYEPVREHLQQSLSPSHAKGMDVKTCSPVVEFQADVEYKTLRVTSEQVEIAREMAKRVEAAHKSYHSGDEAGAKASYTELQRYLEHKRAALVGDFKNGPNITSAVAMHGVGAQRRAAADGDCGGLVIFIIIEIFIA